LGRLRLDAPPRNPSKRAAKPFGFKEFSAALRQFGRSVPLTPQGNVP
jgi:hypothetical protein